MKKHVLSQAIAVAITAFSPQLPAADVLEDFESGPGGFLENTPIAFSVSNGRYIFHGNRDSRSTYFLPWSGGSNPGGWKPNPSNSNYFDNFTVSIDSLWEGGANNRTYGIFICGQKSELGTRDYVGFYIDGTEISGYDYISGKDGTGYGIVTEKDGKANIPVNYTPSSLIVPNKSNNVSIKKNGHELRFYINSTEVERLSIDWCEGGSVGIEVSESVDASFDNFTVTTTNEASIAEAENCTAKGDVWVDNECKPLPTTTGSDGPTVTNADGTSGTSDSEFSGGWSENGEPYKSTVTYDGGEVSITQVIHFDPAHVGKEVDTFILLNLHLSPPSGPQLWYQVSGTSGFIMWDESPATIEAFETHTIVADKTKVVGPYNLGVLKDFPTSDIKFEFGYRTNNGTIIFSGVPTTLEVR